MRLSRLYSNDSATFSPIVFRPGLSAIVAEIRLVENLDVDVHNLGKSIVGELLDFCLLKGKSNSFFLYKEEELFRDFVFYLEVHLPSGQFLTIRRSVDPGTRIDMIVHDQSVDASSLDDDLWSHSALAFDRAKLLLDGYLGIVALRPWPFRKIVGYLLRSQTDYDDVFKLGKFSGKHQDWKPFVAHLLGLDSGYVKDLYDKREELAAAEGHLSSLLQEWGSDAADPSLLDGLISVKRREVEERQAVLESFDFAAEDQRVTAVTIEEVETRIAAANEERYRLGQLVQRIEDSLKQEQILFKPAEAEKLFREAGVVLGTQVRHDYEQLIAFNRAIGLERRGALEAQLEEVQSILHRLGDELVGLNRQQADALSFLRESAALTKYKDISTALTELRAQLKSLEGRRAAAARLTELRRDQRTLSEQYGHLETLVEEEIQLASGDDNSHFGRLRHYFDEIIHEVVGHHALIAITMNSKGGLDFTAEFIGESGSATSEGQGTSYRKLLCLAFDLAMLRTFLGVAFPRFVFHDGAFEQLEPRKQAKLLAVLRTYASLGIQPVVTALDSDLPKSDSGDALSGDEIILRLHDEGESGRLFRMQSW
jgi:uncharacterized protein YydD (DUF2326 family)